MRRRQGEDKQRGIGKTGAGGVVLFYNAFGSSANTVTETNTGNNFSNLTFPSGATIIGWRSADGTTPGSKKTVTNNTFNNLSGGIYSSVLYVGFSDNTVATNNVSGNVISNVAGNGNPAEAITNMAKSAGSPYRESHPNN